MTEGSVVLEESLADVRQALSELANSLEKSEEERYMMVLSRTEDEVTVTLK